MQFERCALFSLLTATLILHGCGDAGTDLSPEGSIAGECDDGEDNDNDGEVDCDDDGCSALADCEEEVVDLDGDGVPAEEDCDDSDASMPNADADCDGVLTADDCDDADPAVGIADVDDSDCDGVPTHAGGGDMIRIAASTFDMGCTPGQSDCETYEMPVMPVTLTHDYYIGETEVTQGQYEAVMGTNPSFFSGCADCPVEHVNWHMAAAYTNALSTSAGLTECYTCTASCVVAMNPYTCDGYRLPTEAEWEGAARCGGDLLYAGSNTAGDVGWYGDWGINGPRAVAGLDANACGLYDMSGNVFELTQDWYSAVYYTSSGLTDPRGPSSTEPEARTCRGGSYMTPVNWIRVAYRSICGLEQLHGGLGFRLTRTIP